MSCLGKRRSPQFTWTLVASCVVVLLAACTSGAGGGEASDCELSYEIGSESDDRLSYRELDSVGELDLGDDVQVGVVLKTLSNEYWAEVKRGAEAAGELFGVDVTVQAARDEASESEQLTVAQTMVNQEFDAYVIAPINDANLTPAIQEIKGQCKPLVEVIEPGVVANTYIGADEREVGHQAAEFLADNLPPGADVLHIEGQAGSQAGVHRTEGFTAGAEESGLKLVGSGVGDWNQTVAFDATQQLLQRFPEAAGVYAANDTMALGVAAAIDERKAELIVVGTDAIPAAINLIRNGQMGATNTPFPYYQGCKAVEAALHHLSGNDVPAWVESGPTLIDENNVDAYFQEDNSVVETGSCQPPEE
jgi:ribose transport system substrate-binding protein